MADKKSGILATHLFDMSQCHDINTNIIKQIYTVPAKKIAFVSISVVTQMLFLRSYTSISLKDTLTDKSTVIVHNKSSYLACNELIVPNTVDPLLNKAKYNLSGVFLDEGKSIIISVKMADEEFNLSMGEEISRSSNFMNVVISGNTIDVVEVPKAILDKALGRV